MTTEEKIAIMQAYADGKQIEFRSLNDTKWYDFRNPSWNWVDFDYRIKPEPKYRPYKDFNELYDDWEKHGGWYVDKKTKTHRYLTYFDEATSKYLLKEGYVWADDGSPCGVKEE